MQLHGYDFNIVHCAGIGSAMAGIDCIGSVSASLNGYHSFLVDRLSLYS